MKKAEKEEAWLGEGFGTGCIPPPHRIFPASALLSRWDDLEQSANVIPDFVPGDGFLHTALLPISSG
jgi:hypothetical protein